MSYHNRRGVPWSRAKAYDRVVLIRYGEIGTRTGKRNKWGHEIFVGNHTGRSYGYCGQMYVKPVHTYREIFGELK